MILAIDIGNTHIVLGLMEGLEVRASWRVATDLQKTSDEYFSVLQGLLSPSIKKIKSVLAVSVVPALDGVMEEVAKKHLSLPFRLVTHKNIPIKVLLPHPEEVGADRLINAFAVRELYGKPAIVIDFGTATTFDAVSERGEYLGGSIAPGIGMARDALHEKTAKLPKVDLQFPEHAIGRGTDEAIRSGLLLGYSGLVEKIVGEFKKELGGTKKGDAGAPQIIATGGLGDLILDHINFSVVVDKDLTLKGLALISK